MDPDTVETTRPPASTTAAETASQPNAAPPVVQSEAPQNAWPLVAQLVEAGEWPEPELLERILSAGEGATEPLVAVLQSRPRGWPAESILEPVIGLLRTLGPPAAIPELIKILKDYKYETAEAAADALVDFGTPGFDALLELCNDQSIGGYPRNFVFEAAVYAAGDDPAKKARLAEVLRPVLEERIAKAREELRLKGWLQKLPPRDESFDEDEDDLEFDDEFEDDDENMDLNDEFRVFDEEDDEAIDEEFLDQDEDLAAKSNQDDSLPGPDDFHDDDFDDDDDAVDEKIEPEIAEELAYVVGALADLGDPLARDAINSAFQEGLVDEAIVDQAEVDCGYQEFAERGASLRAKDWLSAYREDYAAHLEALEPPPTAPRIYVPPPRYEFGSQSRHTVADMEPMPLAPSIAPIRNAGPKLGRNDPCWCGSGRKYKKCHLGEDAPAESD